VAGRTIAWAAYVPIPGAAWLVARAAPRDRLVRHHARQGGLLAIALWLLLLGLGLLLPVPGMRDAVSAVLGAVLGLAILALAVGIVSAARGRYVRLRPLWDLAALIGPPSSARSPPSPPPPPPPPSSVRPTVARRPPAKP
jgi:uncharacterized membrane protein